MNGMKRGLMASILILSGMAVTAPLGLGQVMKEVDFSINVPYALRMGNYVLPAGSYVLRQVNREDLDTFWLYEGNMTHSPIATVRTTRIDYMSARHYPNHTKMLLKIDESSGHALPVLTGWNIPGDDGWQIIAVYAKNHTLARAR